MVGDGPEDGSGGDSANLLTPPAYDPNTTIQETKCFVVNIKRHKNWRGEVFPLSLILT